VPRLLALAAVVRDPSAYGIDLPDIPDAPYTELVHLPGPIDLAAAADFAAVEVAELRRCNPALTQGKTDPAGPHSLLVPVAGAGRLKERLALAATPVMVAAKPMRAAADDKQVKVALTPATPPPGRRKHEHRIIYGDTLSHLATRFGVSVADLAAWNKMERAQSLIVGRRLVVWLPTRPES
jgi:membrane-bound lytic murein transglycosylase D